MPHRNRKPPAYAAPRAKENVTTFRAGDAFSDSRKASISPAIFSPFGGPRLGAPAVLIVDERERRVSRLASIARRHRGFS
jgi:hypothetical protein